MKKDAATKLVDAYGMACGLYEEHGDLQAKKSGSDLGELCDALRNVLIAELGTYQEFPIHINAPTWESAHTDASGVTVKPYEPNNAYQTRTVPLSEVD